MTINANGFETDGSQYCRNAGPGAAGASWMRRPAMLTKKPRRPALPTAPLAVWRLLQ